MRALLFALAGLFAGALPTYAQDLVVEPGGYTDFRTAPAGDWKPAGTNNALALALRSAQPGDEVGFTGEHNSVKFNWLGSEGRDGVNGGTVGVTVYGMDETAAVRGLSFANPTPGHNADLTFRDFTVIGMIQRPVIFKARESGYGLMTFEGIRFEGDRSKVKWWVHAPASGTWRFVNCTFGDGAIEHGIYLFSPVEDPRYPGEPAMLVDGCYFNLMGRTAVQVVQREVTGLKGSGKIVIQNTSADDCGARDGGSAFTIAGHLGPVEFRRLRIFSNHAAVNVGVPDRGAIVCYKDFKMGADVPADGFGVGDVLVQSVWVKYASPDRSIIMLSSCRAVQIVAPLIIQAGNGKGLNLEHNGQKNGSVQFIGRSKPSTWRGWQGGATRINGNKIGADQLDAMYQGG